jgi:transposase
VRYIAQHLNIARSTVQDTLSRFRETNEFTRRPGSGRRRSTNARDDRFLHFSVQRDRGLPANVLAGRLAAARGVTISEQTMRRRLIEGGLSSRSPATGPRLTAAHRRARLEFALEHVDWGVNVVTYESFIEENVLLMDNNARPHRAKIVDQYLEQVGVQGLPWPACSLDLNPIEHV